MLLCGLLVKFPTILSQPTIAQYDFELTDDPPATPEWT